MSEEWDEVRLWALAETLAARMEAIQQGVRDAKQQKQRELDLGPGGNIVQISDYCRRDCACRMHVASTSPARSGRRGKARPAPSA